MPFPHRVVRLIRSCTTMRLTASIASITAAAVRYHSVKRCHGVTVLPEPFGSDASRVGLILDK